MPKASTDLDELFPPEERASAIERFLEQLAGIVRPKPRLNIWQWADRERFLARGVSAKSVHGHARYVSAEAPHQREPQESFTHPEVQVTVLLMASQIGGKTEMINNALGYFMHQRPANCVVMYPTIDSAEKYSKKKFMPMVRATPALDEILANARSRDSGNTILIKEYLGGSIFFVGANSTPSLRQASGEVLIGDEIDSNESSAGDEGDPVELLWRRGESFPRCVKILSSTPTIKGASPILSWFDESDQRYWHMPCAHCGREMTFAWSMVSWPQNKPEEAVILCPHSRCGKSITDKQRLEMYHAGYWKPTKEFKGVRGYHLNGIYCPWPAQKGYKNRLHQFAAEHLRAVKKGREAIKVRVNTFFCEGFEEEADRIEASELMKRREDYGPILPASVLFCTASVDVQGDRLELSVKGWGVDYESWAVQYRVFPGSPIQPAVWNDLDRYLLTARWKTADGRELTILTCGIDMGGQKDKQSFADHVLAFCKKRFARRVYALKGSNQHAQPLTGSPSRNNRRRCPVFMVGTDTAKGIIAARLRIEEHGPGYMHFPAGMQFGYDQNYFNGLCAEEVRTEFRKGRAVRAWHKKAGVSNEPLDLDVYNEAVLNILQPDWTALAKNAERQAALIAATGGARGATSNPRPSDGRGQGEGEQPGEQKTYQLDPTKAMPGKPTKPAPARPPFRRRGGGGFIGGWKK